MTSKINELRLYDNINENFPVAGQDNDTQVFRDNFDAIKQSVTYAGNEITDLQTNSARTDVENDFNKNIILNAVLQNVREQTFEGGAYGSDRSDVTVNFENGPYQYFIFTGTDKTITFDQFPGDPSFTDESKPIGVGKVTLEIYGDSSEERIITFATSGGTTSLKTNGFALSKVGDTQQPLALPTSSAVTSGSPVIVEVWRRSEDSIFVKYVGQFA